MTPAMTRLLQDLQVVFPGAMTTDLQAKLFNVSKEFFEFTNVWYEDITVNIVANTAAYTLTPVETPIGQLVRLQILYNPDDPRQDALYWVSNARFILPTTLMLGRAPSNNATWVARMSKSPDDVDADNNPALPDWVIQRYRDFLIAGVRRDMMLDTNKPWSDVKLASFWGAKFLSYKTEARVDAIKGNVVGQTNWQFPTLVSGSQRGV
jgi:hypothetical protein